MTTRYNLIDVAECMTKMIIELCGTNRFEKELFPFMDKLCRMQFSMDGKNLNNCDNQTLAWLLLTFIFTKHTSVIEQIKNHNRVHVSIISEPYFIVIIYICRFKYNIEYVRNEEF